MRYWEDLIYVRNAEQAYLELVDLHGYKKIDCTDKKDKLRDMLEIHEDIVFEEPLIVLDPLDNANNPVPVNPVAPKEEKKEEVIEEKVYAVFSPKEYERRYEKGGIGDTKNMIEEVRVFANEIVIEITNLTSGNSKYRNYWQGEIQPLIEEGNYMWNGEMPPPRPFIDEAQSIVDNTDRIYNVIMKVLRKYGW